MTLSIEDVLAEQGHVARRLSAYEVRPQQLQMANAVADAIQNEKHLVVEAGTGVGKSFAYLVPAILAAAQNRKPNERTRIVVSTHTISLQEQLISRDIPFLNSILPLEFSAVLVKGRGNYISIRRLKSAYEKSRTLFEDEEMAHVQRVHQWASQTSDGSRSDLNFSPKPTVWDEVRSDHGNCLGRKCPTYDDCFYYKARRRVWNADVLVVNHALFFSDLALRREGASVLPEYDVAILDEAHTLEDVAASHMGLSISNGQFTYLFNKLYNDRTGKGILLQHNLLDSQQLVSRLRYLVDAFFDEVDAWRNESGTTNGRVLQPLDIQNNISPDASELALQIRQYASELKSDEQKINLLSQADRLEGLSIGLKSWLQQQDEDVVYWVETTSGRSRNVKLLSSPVQVGETLRDELFNEVKSVILTSATLSVGKEDFSFYKDRIGLHKTNELKLGSPFNYREQVQLVIPNGMPDPNENGILYEQAVAEQIQEHVAGLEGGAFVLFTSYRMLKSCSQRLSRWFSEQNRLLLCQGQGLQRTTLLEKFRKDGQAVLFGTETFWQGVDVPGDALKLVIITKLPFSVPDHPLLEARVERIRQQGGNPFTQYQVPEAAIKLRQGFGRLIRTATDTGKVVILDPRIRTKSYGKIFLESLPECEVVGR